MYEEQEKECKLILKDNVLKFFFENLYTPIGFDNETHDRILCIFKAVSDVSHEVRAG